MKWSKFTTRSTVIADLIAGITVALVLIPQAIAYAQLAGLPPQYGLYASLIPPALAALFGSSRRLATGPTAIISLMTASALGTLAISEPEDLVKYAIILAMLVGLIQLMMGILHMGVVVNFISHPVLIGFSNAAAIIIGTSQLPKVFGVVVPHSEHYYEQFYHFILEAFAHTHWPSVILGAMAFVMILSLRKINKKIPAILIAMVVTTLISWVVGFSGVGSVVGEVPKGLPSIAIPGFDLATLPSLFSTAMVIALLGFMESVAITKSLAVKTGEKLNPNQELIGQGTANFFGSFGGGYPVAGSFSRSLVNYESGAQTGLASLFTAIFVVISLLFLTPLLFHLPQPALAAAIIASVLGLIDFGKIKEAWHTHRSDGIVAITAFTGTLVFAPELDRGILIGVIISTAYYIYSRTRPQIEMMTRNKEGVFVETDGLQECKHILIVRFDGSLFFADADYLESKVLRLVIAHPRRVKYVILWATGINYIDFSGIEMLAGLVDQLHEMKTQLVVVGMKPHIMHQIEETEFYEKLGKEYFYHSRKSAIRAIYDDAHTGAKEKNCPLKEKGKKQ